MPLVFNILMRMTIIIVIRILIVTMVVCVFVMPTSVMVEIFFMIVILIVRINVVMVVTCMMVVKILPFSVEVTIMPRVLRCFMVFIRSSVSSSYLMMKVIIVVMVNWHLIRFVLEVGMFIVMMARVNNVIHIVVWFLNKV